MKRTKNTQKRIYYTKQTPLGGFIKNPPKNCEGKIYEQTDGTRWCDTGICQRRCSVLCPTAQEQVSAATKKYKEALKRDKGPELEEYKPKRKK
jgi:hypothetical protein